MNLPTRPLSRLAEAATALGEDLERAPLAEQGPLEVRRAAAAFNRMQGRIRELFAERTRILAAITHDPAVPDFANTVTALERSGKLLSKVSAVFYDLVSAHSSQARFTYA